MWRADLRPRTAVACCFLPQGKPFWRKHQERREKLRDIWKCRVRTPVILYSQESNRASQVVKNPPTNAGDGKRIEFDPWVGQNPQRRKWQPTPIFLPGKSHRQRSLARVHGLQSRTWLSDWAHMIIKVWLKPDPCATSQLYTPVNSFFSFRLVKFYVPCKTKGPDIEKYTGVSS